MYADFDWDQAPLSSQAVPIVAGAGYLVTVAVLPHIMRAGCGKGLDKVMIMHNALLSMWSLLMFLGCLWEMLRRWQQTQNYDWVFCEEHGQAKGPLYFWTYVFYISKYYEMVDTILALLKGSRPPHFGLHVFHHSLVPVVVWNWLEYRQSLQFPGLLFNTFVHVVMYAYYACRVLGIPTPWKRWVTRLQIVQFLTSLVLLVVTLSYLRGEPFGNGCAGVVSMWLNVAFNVTLLWQFIGVLLTPNKRKSVSKEA